MSGYVYFIAPEALFHRSRFDEGRFVKIGFTKSHPHSRLRTLQTGCPLPLKVYAYINGSLELEQALHRTFEPLRHMGEWFYAHDKLFDFLCHLGDEPKDAGCLIPPYKVAEAVFDSVFTDFPPHPSVEREAWEVSANPHHMKAFFPDEYAESMQ